MPTDPASLPPAADEIEISLMGPGRGESIVVHVGDGKWLIIDSCKDGTAVAPLRYLNDIGVNPATQVVLIAATHWHDDHTAGLLDIVKTCAGAKFCCPIAFAKTEFFDYIALHSEIPSSEVAVSTREIYNVMFELGISKRSPLLVTADTLMYNFPKHGVSISSLSPSSYTTNTFLATLARLIPKHKDNIKRSGELRPNEVAAAMLISLPNDSILLGADMEERGIHGWSTLLASSETIKERVSSVFKVPHHGSENAHCDDVWSNALISKPIAILTTYSGGHKPRPSPDDAVRILGLTDKAYCTSRTKATAPVKLITSAERTLEDLKITRTSLDTKFGHIRLRKPITSSSANWRVETFKAAGHLKFVHT